jgi:6-phosphofructokinase 1
MGRNSGYIAIQCGIGGGAEMVMVPETATTVDDVIHNLKEGRDKDKTSSIIVVAEGEVHGNAHEIADKVLSELPELDIRVSTLGHVQRGGTPTAFDRILASRLGMAAVEGLVNGKKGMMVGIVDNQIQYTSFKIAISKSKPIDEDMLRMVKILSI